MYRRGVVVSSRHFEKIEEYDSGPSVMRLKGEDAGDWKRYSQFSVTLAVT
jgi:hypothetical protein